LKNNGAKKVSAAVIARQEFEKWKNSRASTFWEFLFIKHY
jgi:hypothetical protein